MHPLVLYDIVRLEHEHAVREAEAQRHVREARGSIGRRRRRLMSVRLHRWLHRPALPAALRPSS